MKPATPFRPTAEEIARRTAWAAAMIEVARQSTADLATLPEAKRRAAITHAACLSDVALQLLSGEPMPPSPFDRG
jgi:hypothetical protein